MSENVEKAPNVPPFVRFVCSAVPMVFDDSLSYYEALSALWKYMQDTVNVINNNATVTEEYIQLTNEMKEYMDNYFDNLDVQEEINNKLDQMAEDGELTELISAYIDPKIIEINQNITSLEDSVDTEITNFKNSVNSSISDIESEVQSLTNGSPKGVYATSSDLVNADPDHDSIYVVTADGKWYYYNTSTSLWTAGGTYLTNATETEDNLNKLNILGFNNTQDRIKELDGYINLNYERGQIDFTDWSYLSSDYLIRTPQYGNTYIVNTGDVIGLSDYTNLEYCYGVLKTDNTIAFHDWRHEDSRIEVAEDGGTLGIVVRKQDLSDITDINTVGRKMFIKKYDYMMKNDVENKFKSPNEIIHDDFVNGTTYGGEWRFNNQRVVTYSEHQFNNDVVVTNDDVTFKMAIHWYNAATMQTVDSGWIGNDNDSFIIPANTPFRVIVARRTEVPGEVADIDTFTAGIKVIEKTYNKLPNLFNPNDVRYGYLNGSGGFEGNEAQVTLTTDFIELNEDRTLSISYEVEDNTKEAWLGIGYYDEDKTFIKRLTQTGSASDLGINKIHRFNKFPSNCKYVRISFRNYIKSYLQLDYEFNYEYKPYEIEESQRKNYALKYNLRSIAHRGWSWSGGAPENTIPAFVDAKKHGFNIVETDIQFSSDDVPVCIHDGTLDRTTNGTGRVIDKTVAQLKELVANAGKEGYPDVRIPTFEEFIQTCRDLELVAYVELKMNNVEYEDSEKYEILMNIVKKYDMQDKVCWLAENFRRLLPIRKLDPYARLMLMSFTYTDDAQTNVINLLNGLLNNGVNTLVYSANHAHLEDGYVALCKGYNIPIEVWTLYTSAEMDALDGYVSGVTSEKVPYNLYLQEKYGVI